MRLLFGALFAFLVFSTPAQALRAVPGMPDSAKILNTLWVLEDIQNQGVIDRSHLTLQISPDGRASGDGGCNRFSGTVVVSGDKITFGTLMVTMRACVAEAMQMQEQKYTAAFESVRRWRIENGLLYLMDDSGQDVLRFYAEDKP